MKKLAISTLPLLLVAALQAGCAATPQRGDPLRSSFEIPRPTCDTSVGLIHVYARIRNDTNRKIEFNLVGDRGPPYDLWWLGYRIHSSAPGEPYALMHNAARGSIWTRTVAVAPGDSVDFNVALFGLRPADYGRYFRIEVRDSKARSYWTPPFELCAVSNASCGCPPRP